MISRKRIYWIVGLALIIGLVGTGAAFAGGPVGSGGGVPSQIDEGAELLPQASITLDQAITAAQGAASGDIGEVELEMDQGQLVFNVEVGNQDVKVSANDGTVLGSETEEVGNTDGDTEEVGDTDNIQEQVGDQSEADDASEATNSEED